MSSEDCSRIALLLTDTLGDLGITQRDKVLWTPDSVKNEIEATKDGGIDLTKTLLYRLQNLEGGSSSPSTQLQSWDEFYEDFQSYVPPWLSSEDISENKLISKLEVLSFLASTLQNRLLRQAKAGKNGTPGEEKYQNIPSESTKSVADGPELPAHLTVEQKEIILECYEGIKDDYEKRRMGMKQRLDVLVSNFEADNADDAEIAEIKKRLEDLSFSSTSKIITGDNPDNMDEAAILKHFSTPHSKDVKRSPMEKSPNAASLDPAPAANPGGKPNETGSRVIMPEWSDSKALR